MANNLIFFIFFPYSCFSFSFLYFLSICFKTKQLISYSFSIKMTHLCILNFFSRFPVFCFAFTLQGVLGWFRPFLMLFKVRLGKVKVIIAPQGQVRAPKSSKQDQKYPPLSEIFSVRQAMCGKSAMKCFFFYKKTQLTFKIFLINDSFYTVFSSHPMSIIIILVYY